MVRLIAILVTIGTTIINLIRNPTATMVIIMNAIRLFFTITAPILGQFFTGLVALWTLATAIVSGAAA